MAGPRISPSPLLHIPASPPGGAFFFSPYTPSAAWERASICSHVARNESDPGSSPKGLSGSPHPLPNIYISPLLQSSQKRAHFQRTRGFYLWFWLPRVSGEEPCLQLQSAPCILRESRDVRILGCWDSEMLGCRDAGMMGYWDAGVLGCWDTGLLGFWDAGMLG